MSIRFAVLASGSRGNASLVRAGDAGMLIDLGLSPRMLLGRLEALDVSLGSIASALITHTHGDHVHAGALPLLVAHRVRLYCHEGHRDALGRKPGFAELDAMGLVRHYDDRPFLSPSGCRIEPVALSHDGGPTFGFRVEARGPRRGRPASLGYLTDTGTWSEPMADAFADVEALGVEFNHDVDLQRGSGRAPYLIARNLGPRGHLSNAQGAGLVASILGRSRPGALRHLVLLHLSEQCNRPELAITEARGAVRAAGRRVGIHAAGQGRAYPDLMILPSPKRRAPSPAAAAEAGFPWESGRDDSAA